MQRNSEWQKIFWALLSHWRFRNSTLDNFEYKGQGPKTEKSKGKQKRKKLTTRSGLRADMRGEEAAEGIELSTDKMDEGRDDEEEEEEEEELSSLSCWEWTVTKSTCWTMAGWVRQEEEE